MNRLLLMVLKNIVAVPSLYGKLCHYAKHTDRYAESVRYAHIQDILTRAVKAGNVTLQVSGKEHIPAQNGFLMYGNHQGLFDVLSIAATCDNPLGAVLKKELYNIPFVHQVALCTESFPMDREDVRQSMTVIHAVTEELQKGRNYLIFPEGTRSKHGNRMLPFHHGSFRPALKAKCPIVPVALIDNFRVLDQKGSAPVTVQIHYLPPIFYEEYAGMKTAALAELVQSRIAEKITACTGESAYADVADDNHSR